MAVKSVMESIWDDPRHTEFQLIAMQHCDQPLFEGWPFRYLEAATIKDEPGLQKHEGVHWLGNLDGGLERFYGDALRYHH